VKRLFPRILGFYLEAVELLDSFRPDLGLRPCTSPASAGVQRSNRPGSLGCIAGNSRHRGPVTYITSLHGAEKESAP